MYFGMIMLLVVMKADSVYVMTLLSCSASPQITVENLWIKTQF